MPTNYITLTRQQLYDMVWSTPMSTLAKDFGITDSGLAKRCRAVDVPIPYRGYWARKAAGQKPSQTPLPKYRRPAVAADGGQEGSLLSRATPKEIVRDGPEPIFNFEARPPQPENPAQPSVSPEHEALAARLLAKPPTVRTDLRGAHAAIKRTALHLKAQRVKDLDWLRGERAGPIVRVTVAKPATQRALRVADGVLRAAENLNWPFQAPKKEPDPYRPRYRDTEYQGPIWGCLIVEGEPLQITITERQMQVPHELTEYEKENRRKGYNFGIPPWDLAPTGDLRVNLAEPDGRVFRTIADRAKRRLEDQISEVLHAMLERALEEKRWRESRRRAEIAERKREQLAELARQRHEAHSKLIAELERQAGAWYRARLLRRYVQAAQRQLGNRTVEAKLQGETVDFFTWASSYIKQLDPLSTTSSHPDQAPRHSSYGSNEAALKGALLRLFGHDDHVAWKLGVDATTGNTADSKPDQSVDEGIEGSD